MWESALQITPDNVLVMRNLGAVYFLLDRPDEAASILQRALEVAPAAPIYTDLGTIRFFQGRYTDAVAAFEKAVEQAANNHLHWGNLGDGLRWAPGRRRTRLPPTAAPSISSTSRSRRNRMTRISKAGAACIDQDG